MVNSEWARMNSVSKSGGRLAFGSYWPAEGHLSSYRPAGCDTGSFDKSSSAAIREDSIHAHHAAGDRAHHPRPGVKAYTLGSAYVSDLEKQMALEVGKLADIVVLEKDLYKISPSDISTTKVKMTTMTGR